MKKDPFRAQVQWYSRIEQLPPRIRKWPVEPPLDIEWEVVNEGQRYQGDISIETIFGKCSIQMVDVETIPAPVGKVGRDWVFFCRFALGAKTAKHFLPVKDPVSQVCNTPSIKKLDPASVNTAEKREEETAVTPKSRRTPRVPTRYSEDFSCLLPSPLKNSTFSVQKSKTKELCVVIQRCDSRLKEDKVVDDKDHDSDDDFVKVKARKKLLMEDNSSLMEQQHKTPTKRASTTTATSSTKKRLKMTPSTRHKETLQEQQENTPKKPKRGTAPSTPASTTKKRRISSSALSLSARKGTVADAASDLGQIRKQLHVSAVPQNLPCREEEFSFIYDFVEGNQSPRSRSFLSKLPTVSIGPTCCF